MSTIHLLILAVHLLATIAKRNLRIRHAQAHRHHGSI
jgi:hypothetical protein